MRTARLGPLLGLAFMMAGLSVQAHSGDRSDFRRPEEIPFPADNLYTSEKAALGKALFFDARRRGRDCVACHSGWNFTDNGFHDTGLPGSDPGRSAFEPDNLHAQNAFKTPTLRDIGQRAPYMHNGELATLAAVVTHYAAGGVDRPSRDPLIGRLVLSGAELSDLVAFLNSLTGTRQVFAMPVLPN